MSLLSFSDLLFINPNSLCLLSFITLVVVDALVFLHCDLSPFDMQEGFSFRAGLGPECTLYQFCDPSFSRILLLADAASFASTDTAVDAISYFASALCTLDSVDVCYLTHWSFLAARS